MCIYIYTGKTKFGNLCLVDYFSVVTMLIGIVFYIVGKPVYLPSQWCPTCKDHAFVGWAAQLIMWVAPKKNLPKCSANGKQCILIRLPGSLQWLPFTVRPVCAGVVNTDNGTWTCGGMSCSVMSPGSVCQSWTAGSKYGDDVENAMLIVEPME